MKIKGVKKMKEKVYLVGYCGPESNNVCYVCKTKEKALKRFNEIRKDFLKDAKKMKNFVTKKFGFDEMWNRIIKNLQETDPDKIDNYPHETPYIQEMELE